MDIQKLLKKYEEELKTIGEFQIAPGCWSPGPIINSPITARENFLRFGRREKPMFMPFDTDEVTTSPAVFPDAVARGFCVDNVGLPPEGPGGKDMFGVEWVFIEQAGGSMVKPGNPTLEDVCDWESVIHFPNPDDWDWKGSAKANRALYGDAYATDVWIMNGLFERLISFMDFEYAAMALIDEDQEDAVKALFQALTDTYIKILDHCIDAYHINGYLFHDDWGSQRSPFFSKNTWLEMIAPYVKQLVDHCHARNVIFELHSCGCTETMIDVISSIGIDMWRPQPMNNIKKMYDEYGDKIKLGIRAPLFPAGTPAEVEIQAAKDMLASFNTPGKFVFTNNFMESDVFRRALYEESRKMYLQQP